MASRPIAYSLVRLMGASRSPTPRGIDRIDMGILTRLFETWPGECFGVAPTLLGPRLFSREHVLRGCRNLQAVWRETIEPEQDPVLRELDAFLSGGVAPQRIVAPQRPDALSGILRALRLLFSEKIEIGSAIGKLPRGTLYLDMGHDGLTFPTMTGWLDKRPDVAPVVLIHDIIPLLHPAFEKPDTVRRHKAAVLRARQLARLILTPTQAVADELERYLMASGGPKQPVRPCPLPVDDLFLAPRTKPGRWAETAYFVVCGTLEPRKNQTMLIEAWETLGARMGDDAPILVIAGARGSASEPIEKRIREQPLLTKKVVIAAGLGSLALARLIADARALLMPSMAEGFGLPPLEAVALGTPALVSDIPAHRDAIGAFGQFLPPEDAAQWAGAIESLTTNAQARAESLARIKDHAPRSWNDYMGALTARLDQVESP